MFLTNSNDMTPPFFTIFSDLKLNLQKSSGQFWIFLNTNCCFNVLYPWILVTISILYIYLKPSNNILYIRGTILTQYSSHWHNHTRRTEPALRSMTGIQTLLKNIFIFNLNFITYLLVFKSRVTDTSFVIKKNRCKNLLNCRTFGFCIVFLRF